LIDKSGSIWYKSSKLAEAATERIGDAITLGDADAQLIAKNQTAL
jgi:hypothetical protein